MKKFKIEVYEVVATVDASGGFTVSDHSVPWPLIATVYGDTPEEALEIAEDAFYSDRYHYTSPVRA